MNPDRLAEQLLMRDIGKRRGPDREPKKPGVLPVCSDEPLIEGSDAGVSQQGTLRPCRVEELEK